MDVSQNDKNTTNETSNNSKNTPTSSPRLPFVEEQSNIKGESSHRKKNKKGPYTLGITLGEGAFAKVKLATHIITKEKVAIKIIDKSKLLNDDFDIQRVKKEISILKKLRHKNIIQLYEILESKHYLYIAMEYCEGRELFDYIVKRKKLSEKEACKFFQQLINGVEYLHKQGIIHRDLKPENILLDNNLNIKISDFGLSTFFNRGQFLQTPCGTPSYAPPEMLRGEKYNGEETDVWSCGIILYAMVCGSLPYAESKEDIICKKIIGHDYSIPSFLSRSCIDLINGMMIIDPTKRLTINQIINHPWFNLVKPEMRPGLSLSNQTPPVDEEILEKVKEFGYDCEQCRIKVTNNKYDSLTAIYYLLLRKHVMNGGTSISDLNSQEFINYINNKPTKIIEHPNISKEKPQSLHKNIPELNFYPGVSPISNKKMQRTPSPTLSISPCLKKIQNKMAKNEISSSFRNESNSSSIKSKEIHLAKQQLYKKKRLERAKIRQRKTSPSTVKSLTQNQIENIENADLQFEEELNKIDSMDGKVNVIQYIAKKLIGNSYYGSFDISLNASRRSNLIFQNNSQANESDNNCDNNSNREQIGCKKPTSFIGKSNIKHSFIKKKEVFIYDIDNDKTKKTSFHHNTLLDISTTKLDRSMSITKGSTSKSPEFRQSPYSKENRALINMNHYSSGKKDSNHNSSKLICKTNIISEVEGDEEPCINLLKKCKGEKIKNIKCIEKNEVNSNSKKYSISLLKQTHKQLVRGNEKEKEQIEIQKEEMSARNNLKRSTINNLISGKKNSNDLLYPPKIKHTRTGSACDSLLKNKKIKSKFFNNDEVQNHTIEINLLDSTTISKNSNFTGRINHADSTKKNKSSNRKSSGQKEKNILNNNITFPKYKGSFIDISCLFSAVNGQKIINKIIELLKKDKVITNQFQTHNKIKCMKNNLSYIIEIISLDTQNHIKSKNQNELFYIKAHITQGDNLSFKKSIVSLIKRLHENLK